MNIQLLVKQASQIDASSPYRHTNFIQELTPEQCKRLATAAVEMLDEEAKEEALAFAKAERSGAYRSPLGFHGLVIAACFNEMDADETYEELYQNALNFLNN